jgi:hypothetical protein
MQALFDFLYAYAEGEYGDILKNVTLIAVPLVNPDGYDECLTQHNAVKKTNANGVDINRNFPCKYWGSKKKKPGNGYPGRMPVPNPKRRPLWRCLTGMRSRLRRTSTRAADTSSA